MVPFCTFIFFVPSATGSTTFRHKIAVKKVRGMMSMAVDHISTYVPVTPARPFVMPVIPEKKKAFSGRGDETFFYLHASCGSYSDDPVPCAPAACPNRRSR